MGVCSRHLDRVEEASRTAVRLWVVEQLNLDRCRCYRDREARRSKQDRVCWGHSAAANRWSEAVVVACLCRWDRAEASLRLATAFHSVGQLTDQARCWLVPVRPRLMLGRVCSAHLLEASHWLATVAHLSRLGQAVALSMFRTESRLAAWLIRHRCCRAKAIRLKVVDSEVGRRSTPGPAYLELTSAVGSMLSKQYQCRPVIDALNSSSDPTRPTPKACRWFGKEEWNHCCRH